MTLPDGCLRRALFVLLASLGVAVLTAPRAATAQDAADVPAWAIEDMAATVGQWVADNAAYRSDDEPFEAYGMTWAWAAGKRSLRGRLYAVQDGQEGPTFWEFRQFWHPGEQRLLVYQFGRDGTVGMGALTRLDDERHELLQTFYRPDGTAFRAGHRTEIRDDEQRGQSYDVADDGTWTERRFYVWRRVAP